MSSADAVRFPVHVIVSLLAMVISGAALAETEVPVDVQAKQESMLMDAVRDNGRHMDKVEAAVLEKSLEEHPDDITTRAKLMGYYFYQGVKQEGAPATIKARRRHITWLIRNHPESPLGGMPEATIDPADQVMADKIGYETASAMWRALVERGDAAQQTMENAYRFLRLNDKHEAEKIALKANNPYLIGEIYALGVSRVNMMNQNGFVLGVGTSREDERYAAHAVEALRKTEDMRVLDSAAAVLLFSGTLAQVMHQRNGVPIEPLPVAFAGELLERCGDCQSLSSYYRIMGMMSTTPAERKKYAQAEMALLEKESALQPSAKDGEVKGWELLRLHEQAKVAFTAGEYDKAEQYATKLLRLVAEKQQNEKYGMELHAGHIVLGRVALHRGNVKAARRHLLAAADVNGGATLRSFGPNMALAKELLEHGERDVVVTYLKRCKRFWDKGQDSLTKWIATIEKGGIPNFGPNLDY